MVFNKISAKYIEVAATLITHAQLKVTIKHFILWLAASCDVIYIYLAPPTNHSSLGKREENWHSKSVWQMHQVTDGTN